MTVDEKIAFQLRLPVELVRRLDELAREEGRSRNEIIVRALRALTGEEPNPAPPRALRGGK